MTTALLPIVKPTNGRYALATAQAKADAAFALHDETVERYYAAANAINESSLDANAQDTYRALLANGYTDRARRFLSANLLVITERLERQVELRLDEALAAAANVALVEASEANAERFYRLAEVVRAGQAANAAAAFEDDLGDVEDLMSDEDVEDMLANARWDDNDMLVAREADLINDEEIAALWDACDLTWQDDMLTPASFLPGQDWDALMIENVF